MTRIDVSESDSTNLHFSVRDRLTGRPQMVLVRMHRCKSSGPRDSYDKKLISLSDLSRNKQKFTDLHG